VLEELTTDRSDASGTAYWGADGYDRDLFVRALGHDAVLPRVLGPGEAAGRTPDGILVGPGAGDNAAAALGLDAASGDVVVSIGTSGNVYPAAGFVAEARQAGARTVELNLEPSEGVTLFDEAVHGRATELVPQFVDRVLASA
jgi:sugar (pentulose or hexulose) kinase